MRGGWMILTIGVRVISLPLTFSIIPLLRYVFKILASSRAIVYLTNLEDASLEVRIRSSEIMTSARV